MPLLSFEPRTLLGPSSQALLLSHPAPYYSTGICAEKNYRIIKYKLYQRTITPGKSTHNNMLAIGTSTLDPKGSHEIAWTRFTGLIQNLSKVQNSRINHPICPSTLDIDGSTEVLQFNQ